MLYSSKIDTHNGRQLLFTQSGGPITTCLSYSDGRYEGTSLIREVYAMTCLS